jgi:AcrR family transcriptional regulator
VFQVDIRQRGEWAEEAIDALDQSAFAHGDDVEAAEEQSFPFPYFPVVAESIVVLIDSRRPSQACVGVLGAECLNVGFETVVAKMEVNGVAEFKVGSHRFLKMASDLAGVGFVPHGEVVIGRRRCKQTHSRYYRNRPTVCKAESIAASARMSDMATQAERRETTRGAIVDAAKELFVEHGFDQTSVTDILERAGISRGALYHHFAAKEDVFAAVFVMTSTDAIRQAVRRIPPNSTPIDALLAGCLGWLDAVKDPAIHRILFVDGPSALGWERLRTLEEATSLGLMRTGVARAVESKEIKVPSVDLAARLLNGLLAEAALILQGGGPARRRDVRALVTAMVKGLQDS